MQASFLLELFSQSQLELQKLQKVIENVQRDVNIALINELSMIFDKLGIDTGDVLEGGWHKVELSKIQTRFGRRSLYWC